MNAISQPQSAAKRPAADADRGFFAYHGFMAPGVRLMRRLNFTTKSALVFGGFLVPIAVLLFGVVKTTAGNVDSTDLERQGIVYLQALIPVLQAEQAHQQNLSAGSDSSASLNSAQTALRHLDDVDKGLKETLGTSDSVSRIEALQGRLGQDAAASSGQGVHDELEVLMQTLAANIADNSGLVLDPDNDSYYVMYGVVVEGMSAVSRIAYLQTHVQLADLGAAAALLADSLRRQQNALDRAMATNASLKADLAADESFAALGHLVGVVKDAVADGGVTAANRAVLQTAVSNALAQQYALEQRGMTALDHLLAARDERLASERNHLLYLSGVCLLLASYLLVAFYQVTNGGFRAISSNIVAMAKGDFSKRPNPWGKDEVASALDDLRTTLTAMSESVSVIRARSSDVSVAAREIASGNMDLSRRTEESVSAIESTTRGVEQLRESSVEYVRAMDDARRQIEAMLHSVRTNESAVSGLVDRMNALNAQSREISDIVSLIDGISFQTNILALNASVEAARAGDQGRGFAVVAQEVRALAQRSAEAAKQIAGIVSSSTADIEAGTKLASQAGNAVARTVAQTQGVSECVARVGEDARRNQEVVDETFRSMEAFSNLTRSNAALVEQVASATASLDRSGEELYALLGRYRVHGADGDSIVQ